QLLAVAVYRPTGVETQFQGAGIAKLFRQIAAIVVTRSRGKIPYRLQFHEAVDRQAQGTAGHLGFRFLHPQLFTSGIYLHWHGKTIATMFQPVAEKATGDGRYLLLDSPCRDLRCHHHSPVDSPSVRLSGAMPMAIIGPEYGVKANTSQRFGSNKFNLPARATERES